MDLSSIKLPSLRKTNERTGSERVTVFVYAPARWGKTNLSRSVANPLILATELGDTMGLQTLSDLEIPWIPIDSLEMLFAVAAVLRSGEYQGYKPSTLVLDSYTHVGELLLDKIISLKRWDDIWSPAVSKDPRSAYPYVAEKGRQVIKVLMDLPFDLLILCREGVQEVPQEKGPPIQFFSPELPGQKLPREVPGWPDATLHGIWQGGQRVLVTKTLERSVAGFRLPPTVPVPVLIKPNIGAVIRLVRGEKEALHELTLDSNAPSKPVQPTLQGVKK